MEKSPAFGSSCERQKSRDKRCPTFVYPSIFPTNLEAVTAEIFIYEDAASDARALSDTIETVAENRQITVNVTIFNHSSDLLQAVENHEPDLLFMDIDAGQNEPDGISLAKQIRIWSTDLPIVFVTCMQEWALLGYEVQALHYLIKPATTQEVDVCFNRLEKLTGRRLKKRRFISVISDYKTLRIPVDAIQYAEVKSNTVTIHLPGRSIPSNTSMTSLEQQVGDALLRCHRSYLINPKFVKRIDSNDFVLTTGERIPIRINGRKNTISQYHDWIMRHMDKVAD